MWFKEYRDYPRDRPLIKEKVESGTGIIGCEMHDLNGWGCETQRTRSPKRGRWSKLVSLIFSEKDEHEHR